MKKLEKLYINKDYNKFLNQYCNWNGFSSINLSFDIDFAPDYMITYLLDILDSYKDIKATFFITHNSKIIDRIRNNKNYELAIHPFDNAQSTQGKGLNNIIDNLLEVVPESIGNRFHRLEHSYNSFFILKNKNQFYDASLFRFNLPFAVPTYHEDINLVLIPYTFEDGTCGGMGHSMKLRDIDLFSPGIKGISFHPLNLYLNCSDGTKRRELFEEYKNINLVDKLTIERYRNLKDAGPMELLIEILELSKKGIIFVPYKELSTEFKKIIEGGISC
ncbi:polysaccharide deacetylase WbmS family protein [Aliarcobacter cryaerophilus]|uniref:polysaccharide deacetylase WbmS family protein n=1 Tax=Aliarcobacter cryaerophilus TaxID=28198 RepID=UPI0021B6E557|nr:hypothetical protein [Aliarcobacter cryaerophilus]MCT7473096.1 hypothetical protein [Aliarcobacter cryaerophilus]